MTDRFAREIDVPDVTSAVNVPAPPVGAISLYGRNGKLAVQDSAGVETILSADAVFNSTGLLRTQPKTWIGTAISNANGVFTVNYASAGFSAPPIIQATALGPSTSAVEDRVWATLQAGATSTQAMGYTLRGAVLVAILFGGGDTTRIAPNTSVHIVAHGT